MKIHAHSSKNEGTDNAVPEYIIKKMDRTQKQI